MIGVSQSSLSRLFRLPQLPVATSHFLATSEGLSRIELALGMFPMMLPARHTSRGQLKEFAKSKEFDDHKDHEHRPGAILDFPSPGESAAVLAVDAPRPVYRLLIAEDDLSLGRSVKKGLEEQHYVVDLVLNGQEALVMSQLISYDLVILDVMLPLVDGFEVCALGDEVTNDVLSGAYAGGDQQRWLARCRYAYIGPVLDQQLDLVKVRD